MKQAGHFWGQEHISHRFYFLITTQGETKMRHVMWEFTLLRRRRRPYLQSQSSKKVTWHFLGIHQENLIKGKRPQQ